MFSRCFDDRRYRWMMLGALLALAYPATARACVVGTGTPASCSEAALDACLPGGAGFDGTVSFACGGAATLVVTGTKVLSADTAIDGGGLITLDGGDAVGVLSVSAGVNATIDGLTIANGRAVTGAGIFTAGALTVRNSTLRDNVSTQDGGGVAAPHGSSSLTVTDSTFAGNHSDLDGGGLYSISAFTAVTGCTFAGNSGRFGGGAWLLVPPDGSLFRISRSIFHGNTATAMGGAVANVSVGPGEITDSSFYSNSAATLGGAFLQGGALATVTNCAFEANSALDGGAIGNASYLAVSGTTFIGNGAASNGGGIWSGGGLLDISNSTLFGNSATNGGGLYSGGNANLRNCTVSGNSATSGGGIWSQGSDTLANTIVAANPTGGNCAGSAVVTDLGHNLDDGTTCGFSGAGCASGSGTSRCGVPAGLDPQGPADNGGPTETIALCTAVGTPAGCVAVSPAIGAGDQSVCSTTTGAVPVANRDQRGFARPGSGQSACAIGAYEAGAVDPSASTSLCPATPQPGCRSAAVSSLLWKQRGGDDDALIWKWSKGAALADGELGDPTAGTNQVLCIYDAQSSSTALSQLRVPGSAALWRPVGAAGFRYSNFGGTEAGIRRMLVKPSADAGKSKVLVKGSGVHLPDPALATFTAPLTIQLLNDATSVCVEAVFDAADVVRSDAEQFLAKHRP